MNRTSIHLFKGVQYALLAVLIVFFGLQAHADRVMSNASFDAIAGKVAANLDPNLYPVRPQTAPARYFGLDPASFEQITLYRNEDAMSAAELLIAKFDNEESAKQLEDAIDKRIESQHSIYEGYAPDQAAQMEAALVDIQGNYGLYYVGDDPAGMEALFRQALKEGGSGA